MRRGGLELRNKVLATLMSVSLVVSMTPISAFAADDINPFDGAASVSTTESVAPAIDTSSDVAVTETKPKVSTDLAAAVIEPEHITFVFDANADDEFTFRVTLCNENGEPVTDGVYINYSE